MPYTPGSQSLSFPAFRVRAGRIYTVPTGAPIPLRGTLWPANLKSELLRRSPPIANTGETRFVLVLDPITNSDCVPGRLSMH